MVCSQKFGNIWKKYIYKYSKELCKVYIPWTMERQIVLFSRSVLLFEKRSADSVWRSVGLLRGIYYNISKKITKTTGHIETSNTVSWVQNSFLYVFKKCVLITKHFNKIDVGICYIAKYTHFKFAMLCISHSQEFSVLYHSLSKMYLFGF